MRYVIRCIRIYESDDNSEYGDLSLEATSFYINRRFQ